MPKIVNTLVGSEVLNGVEDVMLVSLVATPCGPVDLRPQLQP